MNLRKDQELTSNDVLLSMREMLLEASPGEVIELAKEAGEEPSELAAAGRQLVEDAIRHSKAELADKILPLHKGLSSFLVMLRRRDGLDEDELAQKANVDAEEIRRIEYDPAYQPSPRTIFYLERALSLPSGVLARLAGAIKHKSPELEGRVLKFAANAKSMGKLTKEELQLLNEFVKFLTEHA
jgi:transcriptional regulator with XRE-family HTH domain